MRRHGNQGSTRKVTTAFDIKDDAAVGTDATTALLLPMLPGNNTVNRGVLVRLKGRDTKDHQMMAVYYYCVQTSFVARGPLISSQTPRA